MWKAYCDVIDKVRSVVVESSIAGVIGQDDGGDLKDILLSKNADARVFASIFVAFQYRCHKLNIPVPDKTGAILGLVLQRRH